MIGGYKNQYFGKYQFSNIAMREIGWHHVTVNKFKTNKSIFTPDMQEEAIRLLIKETRLYLLDEINRYDGKVFRGIKISEAGIVAASHGAGYLNVKKYFKYNGEVRARKTIEQYLREFSRYTVIESIEDTYRKPY